MKFPSTESLGFVLLVNQKCAASLVLLLILGVWEVGEKKPPCPWICCICSVWSLRCVCGLEHGYFLGKGVRNNKKKWRELMWWGNFSWATFLLPHWTPSWRDSVFSPNLPEQGAPGQSVGVVPRQQGMKTWMREDLPGPTQCYLAVPYLLPAPILDATRIKWACNHRTRWLWRSSS